MNVKRLAAAAATFLWIAGAAAVAPLRSSGQAGPPAAPAARAAADKALYDEKCSACHDLPNPQEKGYTRQQWTRTVNLMLTKYNASESISRAEADRIIDYLATFAPAPGSAAASGDPWATDTDDVWTEAASRTRVINFEAPDAVRLLRQASAGDRAKRAAWTVSAGDISADGHVATVSNAGADGGCFALLIDPASSARDLDVRVRFRIAAGRTSPSVGIAFGVLGADRYHLLRYDAARGALVLMRIDGAAHTALQSTDIATGKGAQLAEDVPARLSRADGEWHTLRLLVRGDRAHGWIDLSKRIAAVVPDYGGGQVGLWSQGDTRAEFDDWITDDYDALPATPGR